MLQVLLYVNGVGHSKNKHTRDAASQRFANVAFDRTVMIFMEFVIVALFAMQLDHCNIQRVFGQR
jgi:hypothetical protein